MPKVTAPDAAPALKIPRHLPFKPRALFCCIALATAMQSGYAGTEHESPLIHDSGSAIAVSQPLGREIVFIDSRVQDSHTLLADVAPGTEVVHLDQRSDGLAQIAGYLEGRTDIDVLHIISHGGAGELLLGSRRVTDANLAAYETELEVIGSAIKAGGDILLYGCDVGAGEKGQAFLSKVSMATGADIAASEDPTGAVHKGGNWQLESVVGTVQHSTVSINGAYPHLLNTLTAGDMVVLGWNSYTDTVILATLVDIPAGTVIKITDKGWNQSTDAFGTYTDSDGVITWTTSSAISAGSIFSLYLAGSDGSPAVTLTNVTTNTSLTADIATSGFTEADPAPVAGDSILIYQDDEANPYFIFGMNNSGGIIVVTRWNSSLSTQRDSMLPDGTGSQNALTEALNAIGNESKSAYRGNRQFTGATTAATRDTWLARVVNRSSWTGDSVGTIATSVGITSGSALSFPNPTPVVDANGASDGMSNSISFTEDGSALGITTTDATLSDDDNITGMTLALGATPDGILEIIAYVSSLNGGASLDSLGLTGSYDSTTRIYTLSGSGSASQYQNVLRAVTYINSSQNPDTTARTVTISATDAQSAVGQATVTINVTAVNDAPTDIGLSSASMAQSLTSAGADVGTLTTTDPDSLAFTYSLVSTVTAVGGSCASDSGNASFQINGAVLETAAALAPGSYNVCVQTDDGADASKKGLVITVTDDVAPVVSSVTVPTNDRYIAGETLSFTVNTSENVTVNTGGGTPYLALTAGATVREAAYVSGTGTSALVFSYAVQASDSDADGVAVGAAVQLNGGTLRDAAGNDLTLALNAVGDTSSVLIDATATVTYNGNGSTGGVVPTDASYYIDGATVTVLGNSGSLSRTGFTFAGWNTSPDGSGSAYDAASTFSMGSSNRTLYAVWIPANPTISSATYDAATGVLVVSGTNFSATSGSINDVVANKLTVTGEGGSTYALINSPNVEITSATSFTLTLSANDRAAINVLLNKSGFSSTTATTYNVAGAAGFIAASDTADTTGNQIEVLNAAPIVTDAGISLSGASGTGGVYKIGDTVTATWNNTLASGDRNTNITGVTVDFSAFGGGAAVVAANSSNSWTATYLIVDSGIGGTGRNVLVTATDSQSQSTTTADTSSATVDVTASEVTSVAVVGTPTAAAASVTFTVAFSESAENVSTDDFTLTTTGSAQGSVASVSASSGTSIDVSVTGISGTGTLRLDTTGAGMTDSAGNAVTAYAAGTVHSVDRDAPGITGVAFDQNRVNGSNEDSVSFTLAGAETGTTASYSITSSNGGTAVTGSVAVSNTNQQITAPSVAGLADGTLTISVTLKDTAGNESPAVTNTIAKDFNPVLTLPANPAAMMDGATVDIPGASVSGTVSASISVELSVPSGTIAVATAGAATVSGGGTADVTITGSLANVNTALAGLSYTAPVNATGTRVIQIEVSDGVGTASGSLTATLNDRPDINELNGSVTFTIGDNPQLLDTGVAATVTDLDNANFAGGTLSISIVSGAVPAQDLLAFYTEGDVTLEGLVHGSDVEVEGVVVGTLINDISEGNVLAVNFNANATPARVAMLLRALNYDNTHGSPTAGTRGVEITLDDGDASRTLTLTVQVQFPPDLPDSAPSGTTISSETSSGNYTGTVTITESGTLNGGTINGTINSSGTIAGDVNLGPNSTVNGGTITGDISGDPLQPAQINNAAINAGASLENVVIGEGTVLEPGVQLGANVRFESMDSIPSGIDLTPAFRKLNWLNGDDRGVAILTDDVLTSALGNEDPMTVIRAIQLLEMFEPAGNELEQDTVSGEILVVANDFSATVLPVQVSQAEPNEKEGVYVNADGDVVFVAANRRVVLGYPVLASKSAFADLIGAVGLQFDYDNRANLRVTSFPGAMQAASLSAVAGLAAHAATQELYYSARPDVLAVPAFRGTEPGLVRYPIAGLGNYQGVSMLFKDDNGVLLEQTIAPTPVDWFALKAAIAAIPGVTAVNIDSLGIISAVIDGTLVRAIVDFTVLKAEEELAGELRVRIVDDLTGNGMRDYEITYANGDRQLLFIFQ